MNHSIVLAAFMVVCAAGFGQSDSAAGTAGIEL
jgi:hypothetical protein